MTFHVPEQFRVKTGPMASGKSYGNNGAFIVSSLKFSHKFNTIASDGEFWEHVSVSVFNRCPTWQEMSYIKDLFWDDDDCVMQLHVPKADWINNHPFTLHLWRPIGIEIPRPLQVMV